MKSPFDRFLPSAFEPARQPSKSRRSRHGQRKGDRRPAELQAETLEKRAMMAIANVSGGPVSDYLIVASDAATDVYMQQHAGQGLYIADNPSFLLNSNFTETSGVPDIVYATNGAAGAGPGPMLPGDNSEGNYQADPLLSTQTWFTLNSDDIVAPSYDKSPVSGQRIPRTPSVPNAFFPSEKFQISNPITGTVTFDGATWRFELDPDVRLVFSPVPTGNTTPWASPVSGSVDYRGRGALIINWSSPVATVAHPAAQLIPAPPQVDITYFAGTGVSTRPESEFDLIPTPGVSRTTSDLPYSATSRMVYRFTIPSTVYGSGTPKGVIQGSLRGSIVVDGRTIELADDFTQGTTLFFNGQQSLVLNPFCTISDGSYASSGDTIEITLNFQGAPRGPASTENANYIAYVEDPNPNSFTLFAGHDLTSQLEVDLLSSDSTIDINSRVTVRSTLGNGQSGREDDIVLRGTNVNINAEVRATNTIRVQRSAVGSGFSEVLTINAPVSAPKSFIFDISDDPNTARPKGQIRISPSGSLIGSPGATADASPSSTDLVLVRAIQSDIYVEGQVYGSRQTFLMNSSKDGQNLFPYVFSTRAAVGGVDTGLIRGGTVSITLGNDSLTPIDGAIAFNTLDLKTRVDSMRISASTQQLPTSGVLDPDDPGIIPTPSPSGPFPYNLSVREYDDISFDAVAASGLPISLEAAGNLRMSSSLYTADDVSIRAVRPTDRQVPADATFDFTVSAPITTTKGRINIQADSVFVNNSLEVTSAPVEDGRNDISLTASAGNILLQGLVSAVNGISLTQRTSTTSRGTPVSPYANPDFAGIPIPDASSAASPGSTAIATILVEDDFEFTDLEVVLDITHRYNSDLAATLIAPNGQRYRLFAARSAGGSNFSNTRFDSESTLALADGAAPYSDPRGYRPADTFAPLYRSSTQGTWQLEVVDSFPSDAGRLNGFQLIFSKSGNQISGPAFLRADRLAIEAEGAVGNPVRQPTANDFYLNTNVDEITVRAGVSVSIGEQDDVNIKSLRAGDLVSLKAGGVDPVSGPNAGKTALQAYVIGVPTLDASSPNGSMAIVLDTAKTTVLGNAFALQRGSAVNSVAAGSVSIRSQAGDIVALDAPLAGGNARLVRVATDADLSAVQFIKGTPGVTADRLLVSNQAMLALRPLNAEGQPLPLKVNDRILVKDQAFSEQNGVYAVTATGPIWTLTRAADSDTIGEFKTGTYVRVGEGPLADTVWQLMYGLRRDGDLVAGIDKVTGLGKTSDLAVGMLVVGEGVAPDTTILSIDDADSVTLSSEATLDVIASSLRFVLPTPEIGASAMVVEPADLVTDIGSDDVNDLVTFVVSTAAGSNSAAGSFGKMVDVYQRNSAKTGNGRVDQRSEFRFSSLVANNRAPIRLSQELPTIVKPVVIDGGAASRYVPKGVAAPANSVSANPVIDGSRITTTRSGRALTASDTINGLTLSGVDGVTIRNVTIGGFNIGNKGAAISVNNSANVLIENVVVGLSETGDRLANAVGVHVTGGESDTTSIINGTVLSSTVAGIKIDNEASYVRIGGTTIGRVDRENNIGIHISAGTNAIGIETAAWVQALGRRVGNNAFTLPAATYDAARRLVPGMGVIGRRIVPNNPNVPVTVTQVKTNEKTKITTVRIAGGRVTGNAAVTVAYVVPTVRGSSVINLGAPLDSDAGRQSLLGLFLGQQVSGTGIEFGSTITKIDEGDSATGRPATITLSQPMTLDGLTAVTLSSATRNVIQANRTGVVLDAGETKMTHTSVIDNNFNGVEIRGGSHTIGTTKTRSLTSNVIHGNGGWGVVLSTAVNRFVQFIRGNYLGANQSTIVSTLLTNKKGNIGMSDGTNESPYFGVASELKPNAKTGVDKESNQHGIIPLVATSRRSRFPWRS